MVMIHSSNTLDHSAAAEAATASSLKPRTAPRRSTCGATSPAYLAENASLRSFVSVVRACSDRSLMHFFTENGMLPFPPSTFGSCLRCLMYQQSGCNRVDYSLPIDA